MNTVTPIASLSDALISYLEPQVDGENRDALREGLDTIAASSKSLIRFVESYRSISRIADKQKRQQKACDSAQPDAEADRKRAGQKDQYLHVRWYPLHSVRSAQ